MSAFSNLSEEPRELAPLTAPSLLELMVAVFGCGVALAGFGLGLGLLVSAWWCLSLVIVKSDLNSLTIPDFATATIAILGVIYAAAPAFHALPQWSELIAVIIAPLERGAITLLCVAAFSFVFKVIMGRDSLGFGDVKLSGALAVWLGAYDLFLTVELACFAALVLVGLTCLRYKKSPSESVIPFGAFLAPAGWFVFVSPFLFAVWGTWHASIW